MDQKGKDPKPHLQPGTRDCSQGKVVGKQRYRTPHDTLRGKHLSDGLSKFPKQRRDQVPWGETPEQGPAEPDLRNGEGGSGYRGSYERGTSSFNSRQETIFGSTDLEEVYEDGLEDAGSIRDVPEERERLDVEKGRQTGHHPQQAETSQRIITHSVTRENFKKEGPNQHGERGRGEF